MAYTVWCWHFKKWQTRHGSCVYKWRCAVVFTWQCVCGCLYYLHSTSKLNWLNMRIMNGRTDLPHTQMAVEFMDISVVVHIYTDLHICILVLWTCIHNTQYDINKQTNRQARKKESPATIHKFRAHRCPNISYVNFNIFPLCSAFRFFFALYLQTREQKIESPNISVNIQTHRSGSGKQFFIETYTQALARKRTHFVRQWHSGIWK